MHQLTDFERRHGNCAPSENQNVFSQIFWKKLNAYP